MWVPRPEHFHTTPPCLCTERAVNMSSNTLGLFRKILRQVANQCKYVTLFHLSVKRPTKTLRLYHTPENVLPMLSRIQRSCFNTNLEHHPWGFVKQRCTFVAKLGLNVISVKNWINFLMNSQSHLDLKCYRTAIKVTKCHHAGGNFQDRLGFPLAWYLQSECLNVCRIYMDSWVWTADERIRFWNWSRQGPGHSKDKILWSTLSDVYFKGFQTYKLVTRRTRLVGGFG